VSQGVTAVATIEILDGPRAGLIVSPDQLEALDPATYVFPLKVRVSAKLFESRVVDLSQSTIDMFRSLSTQSLLKPMSSTTTVFNVALRYVGDGQTDTYTGLADAGLKGIFPFVSRTGGTADVGVYWVNDDFAHRVYVTTEVWCNGQRLAQDTITAFGTFGGPRISQAVPGQTACEVRVTPDDVHYRITVTYPH
jgi:hypothetical protein